MIDALLGGQGGPECGPLDDAGGRHDDYGAQVVIVDAITGALIRNPHFTNPCRDAPDPFVHCGPEAPVGDMATCAIWYVAFGCDTVTVGADGYLSMAVGPQPTTCVVREPCGFCSHAIAGQIAIALERDLGDMATPPDH